MAITVPYKILVSGYQVTGDVLNGYKATVPYLVAWSDAWTFADELLGRTTSTTIGPITWHLPYLFPAAAARLYAQRFTILPCGADGETSLTYGGLAPGEFFTHAKITVEFETPKQIQGFLDDPAGMNQLDPLNPITLCEQVVKSTGKMVTRKAGKYIYEDDSKPVPSDFAKPESETKLELTFPRVPYLPWQLIQPYLNKINSVAILGCPVGNLLLEDFNTKVMASTTEGLQQMLVLSFAVNHDGLDWNTVQKPNGKYVKVRVSGDILASNPDRIFAYADFAEIFNSLQFEES